MKYPLLDLDIAEGGPLIGLDVRTLDRLQKIWARYASLEKVWIFGSRATGTARSGSDIDFAFEGPALAGGDILNIKDDIDALNLPVFIDIVMLHQITSQELLQHIHEEALPIYENKKAA